MHAQHTLILPQRPSMFVLCGPVKATPPCQGRLMAGALKRHGGPASETLSKGQAPQQRPVQSPVNPTSPLIPTLLATLHRQNNGQGALFRGGGRERKTGGNSLPPRRHHHPPTPFTTIPSPSAPTRLPSPPPQPNQDQKELAIG